MPLYEYECDACGQRFEVIRKLSESDLDACTLCGRSPVRRLMSSPAIQFKGTGWYITDYTSKGKSVSETTASKSEAGKADSGSADGTAAKPEGTSGASASKPSSET
jgi:putative FmdB family regulatory protein